jgi:hypothetical protein
MSGIEMKIPALFPVLLTILSLAEREREAAIYPGLRSSNRSYRSLQRRKRGSTYTFAALEAQLEEQSTARASTQGRNKNVRSKVSRKDE